MCKEYFRDIQTINYAHKSNVRQHGKTNTKKNEKIKEKNAAKCRHQRRISAGMAYSFKVRQKCFLSMGSGVAVERLWLSELHKIWDFGFVNDYNWGREMLCGNILQMLKVKNFVKAR